MGELNTEWLQCTLSSQSISDTHCTSGSTLNDKDEEPVPAEMGQNHPFFRRSDSMTFLGCIPPNPFEVPLAEAIPLADQSHLLQVRIHSLFWATGYPPILHSRADRQAKGSSICQVFTVIYASGLRRC